LSEIKVVHAAGRFQAEFADWHDAYGALAPNMPETVLAAIDAATGRPLGLVGLVNTDSDYAIIDGLIRDPELDQALGDRAVWSLYITVGKLAISLGYERAIIHSSLGVVKDRAKVLGAHKFLDTEVFEFTKSGFEGRLTEYGLKAND
jgi:hypothetical protein